MTRDAEEPLLSATIICKDEVDKIRGALESVRFCDEVVVVDSGSTDGTLDICRELADVVVERDWPGHVEQKNRALDLATGRWALSIDADERVTPELAREIQAVLARKPEETGFLIPRHVHYLGSWIDHGGWYPDARVRLFRRTLGRWGGVDPHDQVILEGRVGRLRGDIVHYTYDDMSHHIRTMNSFSTISSREHDKRGRRFTWFQVTLRPPLEFLRMYLLRRGFLDGPRGFYVAVISAFSVFLKFAKLWEIQRGGRARPWLDGDEN